MKLNLFYTFEIKFIASNVGGKCASVTDCSNENCVSGACVGTDRFSSIEIINSCEILSFHIYFLPLFQFFQFWFMSLDFFLKYESLYKKNFSIKILDLNVTFRLKKNSIKVTSI